MKLNIHAVSMLGCVRENNEDMILVNHQFVRDGLCRDEVDLKEAERCIIALADGMGGHSGGEVASSDVLHNLDFYFGDIPMGLSVTDFNEAIFGWMESINNIIDSKGHAEECYRDMGTTLVAFAYYAGGFYWMNCGDSRIYRLHGDKLQQVSTDHSLSNLMGSKKHSSYITNCIGGGCKTSYIDIMTCTDDVEPGDVYMLCSDGLTDMIGDEEIKSILTSGGSADTLCHAALEAGGFDNVSVCVIKIV